MERENSACHNGSLDGHAKKTRSYGTGDYFAEAFASASTAFSMSAADTA